VPTVQDILLLGVLTAPGVAVWGVVVRRWRRGEAALQPMPKEHPPWNPAVVISAVLVIAWQLGTRFVAEWRMLTTDSVSKTSASLKSVQAGFLFNTLVVGFLVLLLSNMGQRRLTEHGLRLDRWRGDLRAGGLGFLASLPPVYLVVLVTLPLRREERTHGLLLLLKNEPAAESFLWVGLAVLVAAPLFEELLFRVILQGWLRSRMSAGPAIGISSVAFAAVHGFPDSLALVPLAVVLGYVFEQRRSYLAVVFLHALFNAAPLLLELLQWQLGGEN